MGVNRISDVRGTQHVMTSEIQQLQVMPQLFGNV